MVDLEPEQLLAHGVTPEEVVNAVSVQNLTLPSGNLRLGDREYMIREVVLKIRTRNSINFVSNGQEVNTQPKVHS